MRSPTSDGVVVGVGARAANGLTALQVTMSARAQKFAPRSSHIVDKDGQSIATARLRSIGDDVIGFDRFVALGGPALTQAAFAWLATKPRDAAPPLPVILALPSRSRPGFDARLGRNLLAALEARSRVKLDPARSELVFGCRGGGVSAFSKALALLEGGHCEAVLVGGIDSYFDPDTLEHLDRELRLHGPETENGFIPGEAAAFTLVVPRRLASSVARWSAIVATASEYEPHPYGSSEPCLGAGITRAVQRAAEAGGAAARPIPWLLTDVANERHRVDEWLYAFTRAHAEFTPDALHEQPLLRTGDVGAASAALLLVMASVRWQTHCAPGDTVLIATHSDGQERGAMVARREAV